MINSWSLLYEELNGTMDETYPIKENNMNEDINIGLSTASNSVGFGTNTLDYDSVTIDTSNFDVVDFSPAQYSSDVITFGNPDPITFESSVEKPQPDLKNGSNQKYQEDKSIAALKNYVTSTYQGHYTNENSDVQTLDLIHSVGDAESFCRSNAIKYLSRYDKKGSAKQDILKAMHYCLLLYYFSGNTKEPDYTNSRYETF